MAAPAAVHTHGSITLVDEPATSSVIQAESFTFTGTREERRTNRANGSARRIQKRSPEAKMVLTGYLIGATGLAIQECGTEITALANFNAIRRGCDFAQGTILLDEVEDSLSIEEDDMTTLSMTWHGLL
jgi:hypothetical protein